jgi:hypothetical protein
VFIGKGTPAPFDPPRKLVIRGPYRFVRNPMYVDGGMILAGVTRCRRRLWRGRQVTVAPDLERGELGFEEETDHATTE